MALSKEEIAKRRAALLAEEVATKKKWCELEGHKFDLPGANPFNHNMMECTVICSRCNALATVTVTIHEEDAAPAAVVATVVPPVVTASKKP
jgi:hypothetical protein